MGIISKDDLFLMNKGYNEEIMSIQAQMSEVQNASDIQHKQTQRIEQYIHQLRQISEAEVDNEFVYKELVNNIVVKNGNVVIINLRSVPFGIQLKYSVSGKG